MKKINKVRSDIIYPNISKLEELIRNYFNNNKSAFARRIGVDRTTISKIFSRQRAGSKFFGRLMQFCEEEDLNYRKYILLQSEIDHNSGDN